MMKKIFNEKFFFGITSERVKNFDEDGFVSMDGSGVVLCNALERRVVIDDEVLFSSRMGLFFFGN
jgi:hypothetical protein